MSRALLATIAALGLTAACGSATAVSRSKPKGAPAGAAPRVEPQPSAPSTAPDCGGGCPPAQVGDVGPKVDFTTPLSGARVSSKALEVRGTASDDAPGVEVWVSVDGQSWTAAPVSSGAFAVNLPLPELDGAPLTVRARATDSAGQSLVALQEVQVDNVAPEVAIDPPSPVPAGVWLAGRLLGGGAKDGSGVAAVRVDRGDGSGLLPVAHAAGRWALTWVAGEGEDDVAHALAVEAVDTFGNVATARVGFRVDVVPPRLRITSPAQGARFNAQALAASAGSVPVFFHLSDGDPSATVSEVGSAGPLASPLAVQTSATDDGRRYTVRLAAADGAGNQTTAEVSFDVDRVAPAALRLAPPDDGLAAGREAEIEFSEPMQAAGPAFDALPAAAGAWSADRRSYRTAQLGADTTYTLTVLPLEDDFGNQLPPLPRWRVRTPPQAPASGTVIATGVSDFAAAADEDGVLAVVARQGATASVYLADPRTGGFLGAAAVAAGAGTPLLAGAHRLTDASGLPQRLASARVGAPLAAPGLFWWVGGAGQPVISGTAAFVHTRGFEAGGTGPMGLVTASFVYLRAFAPQVALSVRPDHVAGVDGRWEVVELLPNGFTRQSFSCERSSPTGPVVCGVSPTFTQTGLGPFPRYSHAITRRCSFHAYDDAAGERVLWTEPFVSGCRLGACPQASVRKESAASELRLATGSATAALVALRTAQGVTVSELIPDASCGLQLGADALLTATDVATFRPVRVGDKPGLVWLDTQGTLRVFSP